MSLRSHIKRGVAGILAGAIALQPMAVSAQGLRFIRDAEIEDLLAAYSRPIFKAAGLGSQGVKVRIIQDSSFNAFVLDGRNVFMNTGTLVEAKTPNMVIGVIAHETGHITGGHLASLRAKIARDSSMAMLMQIMGIGAMIAGAAAEKGGGSATAGAGQSIMSASGEVMTRNILSYRRVQESAADQAGIRYLNATQQSAQGMITTFERFAEDELLSSVTKSGGYVASHPMARDRIAQLQNLAQGSPYFDKADPPELQQRHDLMRAKLVGFLEPPQAVFNRYPASDNSLAGRYARSIASYSGGGLNAALPLIDDLIAEVPSNPYFWEQKADFLSRSGKHGEAAQMLRKALSLAPGQTLLQSQLAQELLGIQDKKHLPEIVKLLRKTVVTDDNPNAYRQLATAYFGLGDEGNANLASAQASVLEGRLKDAKGFAKRAQARLPEGSQGWIKADDILNIQEPDRE